MPSFPFRLSFRIPLLSSSSASRSKPSIPHPSPSLHLHDVIQSLSLAFIRDELREELGKEVRRDKEVVEIGEKDRKGKKGKRMLVGEFGEVLVHI